MHTNEETIYYAQKNCYTQILIYYARNSTAREKLFIYYAQNIAALEKLYITREILLRAKNYLLRAKYCYARETIYYYAQNIATRKKLFITRKILLRARYYYAQNIA